jgi:4-amino-4-deoxychorismate lyase
MYPLFETIRVEDGEPRNLMYHEERMQRSRRAMFGATAPLDIRAAIRIPEAMRAGIVKCRMPYGETIGEVTYAPYERRSVGSLTVVDGGGLDYAHKYADRSGIEALLAGAPSDDILIIKNGLVTDASPANVAFFDGASWLPPEAPLLPGTMRARLLDLGLIRRCAIRPADIRNFEAAALMNAMIGFDTAHAVPVARIAGI